MQVSIVADVREKESRLFDALRSLDVRVDRKRRPVADYVAGSALVERKSVRDLHLAIINGRFWPQIGRLSRTTLRPYLLVAGGDLDAGPLGAASVRMLAAVPGISTVTAQALLDRFGSVAAVLDALARRERHV